MPLVNERPNEISIWSDDESESESHNEKTNENGGDVDESDDHGYDDTHLLDATLICCDFLLMLKQ